MSPGNDQRRPRRGSGVEKVTATNTSVPLSDDEHRELDRLEGVVERGLETFIEVGTALAAIRDKRLYRQTHTNFERYLEDRYDGRLSRRRADQLIAAAEVGTMVLSCGAPAPKTERQARELIGLTTEQAVTVMTTVTDSAEVTAKSIREARQKIAPQPIHEAPKPRRNPLPERYVRTVWELDKITRRLDDLQRDDRFRSHRADLAGRTERLLTEIVGRVAALADDLAGTPPVSDAR